MADLKAMLGTLTLELQEDGSLRVNGFVVTELRRDLDCDGDGQEDTSVSVRFGHHNEVAGWRWGLDTNTNDSGFSLQSQGTAATLGRAITDADAKLGAARRMLLEEGEKR